MTSLEYIQAKMGRLFVDLTVGEIELALEARGTTSSSTVTGETLRKVKLALTDLLPEVLITPDVTEGSLSVKYDRAAVENYYNLLCGELGIRNKLNASKPRPMAVYR